MRLLGWISIWVLGYIVNSLNYFPSNLPMGITTLYHKPGIAKITIDGDFFSKEIIESNLISLRTQFAEWITVYSSLSDELQLFDTLRENILQKLKQIWALMDKNVKPELKIGSITEIKHIKLLPILERIKSFIQDLEKLKADLVRKRSKRDLNQYYEFPSLTTKGILKTTDVVACTLTGHSAPKYKVSCMLRYLKLIRHPVNRNIGSDLLIHLYTWLKYSKHPVHAHIIELSKLLEFTPIQTEQSNLELFQYVEDRIQKGPSQTQTAFYAINRIKTKLIVLNNQNIIQKTSSDLTTPETVEQNTIPQFKDTTIQNEVDTTEQMYDTVQTTNSVGPDHTTINHQNKVEKTIMLENITPARKDIPSLTTTEQYDTTQTIRRVTTEQEITTIYTDLEQNTLLKEGNEQITAESKEKVNYHTTDIPEVQEYTTIETQYSTDTTVKVHQEEDITTYIPVEFEQTTKIFERENTKINEVGKISFPELVLDILKTKQKPFDNQHTTSSTIIQEEEPSIDRPVTLNQATVSPREVPEQIMYVTTNYMHLEKTKRQVPTSKTVQGSVTQKSVTLTPEQQVNLAADIALNNRISKNADAILQIYFKNVIDAFFQMNDELQEVIHLTQGKITTQRLTVLNTFQIDTEKLIITDIITSEDNKFIYVLVQNFEHKQIVFKFKPITICGYKYCLKTENENIAATSLDFSTVFKIDTCQTKTIDSSPAYFCNKMSDDTNCLFINDECNFVVTSYTVRNYEIFDGKYLLLTTHHNATIINNFTRLDSDSIYLISSKKDTSILIDKKNVKLTSVDQALPLSIIKLGYSRADIDNMVETNDFENVDVHTWINSSFLMVLSIGVSILGLRFCKHNHKKVKFAPKSKNNKMEYSRVNKNAIPLKEIS